MQQLPIIDINALVKQENDLTEVASKIGKACREYGFFYIINHGIDTQLLEQLEQLSKEFFALLIAEKMAIHMSLGGSAWRGYFPVGEELTSGKPDQKEGLYFGEELNANHPLVKAKIPLHGQNLFPQKPKEFSKVILSYMKAMTKLSHQLMQAISLSLDLDKN